MAKYSDRRSGLIVEEKERRLLHRPSVWAGALSILLLLMIIGLRFYGDYLYDYPANPALDALPKDSVVVVLAGGKYRIEAAYTLFAEGVGERLFIVGAGKKATAQGLARIQGVEVAQKIPWDRFEKIQVETESRNTIENAYAVKRYVELNPQVKTLILLTSSYHMRRAQYMIASFLPPDVHLVPFTPAAEQLGRKNWWHTWLGISLTAEEYFKFLLALALMPTLKYF